MKTIIELDFKMADTTQSNFVHVKLTSTRAHDACQELNLDSVLPARIETIWFTFYRGFQ